MMQALLAGIQDTKMVLAYSKDDHSLGGCVERNGYAPCPTPLFEVGAAAYHNPDFLRNMPDNLIVKIFFDGLLNLPAGEYIIIFMERDVREIKHSLDRAEKHIIDWAMETRNIPPEETKERNSKIDRTFDVYLPYNQKNIDHVLGIMEQRKDVTLLRVNYRDLIANPYETLQSLATSPLGRERFQLDVAAAAAQIDSKYYRSKYDNGKDGSKERATDSVGAAQKEQG
jgi:hypothetical protein